VVGAWEREYGHHGGEGGEGHEAEGVERGCVK
jgi:hypothetical protein